MWFIFGETAHRDLQGERRENIKSGVETEGSPLFSAISSRRDARAKVFFATQKRLPSRAYRCSTRDGNTARMASRYFKPFTESGSR